MVRFSDMLGGGDGNADDASAKTAPRDLPPAAVDDAPEADAVDEPEADAAAESAAESAQDVLDRLTQYATASRATDQPAPQPAPVAVEPPPAPDADGAVARNPANDGAGTGDDILPRGKRSLRNPRGSKRAK